ncbi:MAG: hypothetical protein WKG07_24375 [Hymenobacter sp.]
MLRVATRRLPTFRATTYRPRPAFYSTTAVLPAAPRLSALAARDQFNLFGGPLLFTMNTPNEPQAPRAEAPETPDTRRPSAKTRCTARFCRQPQQSPRLPPALAPPRRHDQGPARGDFCPPQGAAQDRPSLRCFRTTNTALADPAAAARAARRRPAPANRPKTAASPAARPPRPSGAGRVWPGPHRAPPPRGRLRLRRRRRPARAARDRRTPSSAPWMLATPNFAFVVPRGTRTSDDIRVFTDQLEACPAGRRGAGAPARQPATAAPWATWWKCSSGERPRNRGPPAGAGHASAS